MQMTQVARRGYTASYRDRISESAANYYDRHYDAITFFPALFAVILTAAVLIVARFS